MTGIFIYSLHNFLVPNSQLNMRCAEVALRFPSESPIWRLARWPLLYVPLLATAEKAILPKCLCLLIVTLNALALFFNLSKISWSQVE